MWKNLQEYYVPNWNVRQLRNNIDNSSLKTQSIINCYSRDYNNVRVILRLQRNHKKLCYKFFAGFFIFVNLNKKQLFRVFTWIVFFAYPIEPSCVFQMCECARLSYKISELFKVVTKNNSIFRKLPFLMGKIRHHLQIF